MYNKKLFEKAGIDRGPHHVGRGRRRRQGAEEKAGVDGIYINSGGYFMLPFIYGEGGDLVDTEAKKIVVNSPEAVAGIKTPRTW